MNGIALQAGPGQIPYATSGSTTYQGTYLSAAYRVHPQWELVGGWQWSQSKDESDNGKKWYAWNAAVRYDVTDHWLIKAEYRWTHGGSMLRVAEQSDGTTEKVWSYLAVKTTFDF